MRPVELRLRNVGPFLDEAINFENLENMFIITGNTGAGKTFIFDAMTYALYGELRGNRKSHEKDLKSRYASDDETEFFVEFTFRVAEKIYRVKRTIEHTKKGNKNPTSSEVSVFRRNIAGDFESICNGSNKEKDTVIKNIIGLTASEFSQVILLPQGAFSEFLKQNSNGRSETLKKLFPVQDYTRLMEKAKEKAEDFDKKIKSVEAVINGEFETVAASGISFDDAEERIKEMAEKISELDDKEAEFTKRQKEIASEETGLAHDLEDAETNEKNKNQLESLENDAPVYKNLENKLNLAEKANSLKPYISKKNDAYTSLQDNSVRLSEAESLQKKITDNLEILQEKTSEMKKLSEVNVTLKTEVDSLADKIEKLEDYNKLKTEEQDALNNKNEAETKKNNIEAQISTITETLNGKKIEDLIKLEQENKNRLTELKSDLESKKKDADTRDDLKSRIELSIENIKKLEADLKLCQGKVERTQNTLEAKKLELENFRVKNTAYSIVNVLKPGNPCPVCGSTEHPCPAKTPEGLLNPEEEVKIFEKALDEAKKDLGDVEKNLALENGSKDSCEADLSKYVNLEETEVILSNLTKAESDYSEADRLLNDLLTKQSCLSKLNDDLQSAKDDFAEKDKSYCAVKAKKDKLKEDLGENPDSLQENYDRLSQTYIENKEVYEQWTKNLNTANSDKAGADSSVKGLQETVRKLEEDLENARTVLGEQIKNSDFKTSDEAEMAMMDLEELKKQRKTCEEYRQNVHSLSEAVKNARKVDSVAVLKEKIYSLKNEKESIEKNFKDNHSLLELKKTEKLTYTNSYEKIKEKTLEKQNLEKQALPYKKLYDNLSGNNSAKVPFDVWALGMYFEQVVDYASDRFFTISDHRFEFVLKDLEGKKGNGYKGLDLQVIDHNTPNANAAETASLSGGETFEASISLALAITDVVQNNNGGIVLDSLFIDEGFGTLDSELLDKTMGVLSDLSETKMIGLISHVDSLQDSDSGINSQVNVKKTSNGSTIEIK